ncbi:MAG: hypothetical protein HY078_13155 [Elusimicrobia bacterium]|nr:hypothetical protein [Elusimicrobiota bacterium]
MALKGRVEVKCPRGCGEMDSDVWSFIRGDRDEELKEALIDGELNLLVCEECSGVFYAEVPFVYSDPAAQMLVFCFPDSFKAEESRWRDKMHEDYAQMKAILTDDKRSVPAEPQLLFGIEPLRVMLKADREMEIEVAVAEALCRELKLPILQVKRSFARGGGVPWVLPCRLSAKAKTATLAAVLKGLDELLARNDVLAGFQRWKVVLSSSKQLPPLI